MSLIAELKRRNVLRVAAAYVAVSWLLIQVVETVFPAFGFSDVAVRNVVLVLAALFIPVLVFAWVFELTPEGLKRERDVDHSASIAVQTAKRLDRMIMVVLALALGYFAFDKFVLDPARDAAREQVVAERARTDALIGSYGDNSIVVLPFDDRSPQGDQQYFSDGISEELINLLAKIPDLRVVGRTSAFSFRGTDATIGEIAGKLNVAHVLEGSVRTAGNRVRVTAQLIEAQTDTHLWSETFDRELVDVFAIQDEIAVQVVDALKITMLGAVPRVRATDPRAYAFYLQARSLFNRLDPGVVDNIGDLLEQALEIDPEYVPALLLYARYLGWGGNSEGSDEHWTRLREIINRALAIDSTNGYALSWQGWIAMNADNDMETAARYFMRSNEVDPTNYDNLLGSINTAQLFARPDLSIGFGEYMIERDPLCLACYGRTARAYWMLGRLEEAEARVRTALALDPGWTSGRNMLGFTFLLSGRPEEALAVFERLADERGGMMAAKAMALHDLGRDAEFHAAMEALSADSSLAGNESAQVFAWIGDKDTAFDLLLGEVEAIDSTGMRWVLVEPFYAKLHDDPRWQALLEEYGMSAAQLDAIGYNPRLPR